MAARRSWQADRAERRVAKLFTVVRDEGVPIASARAEMRELGEPVSNVS